MIEFLDIRNFVLIDHLTVDFTIGLNILSGETGAGKSVFIGALSFLFGGRTGVECIRTGCTEASVSGSLLLNDSMRMAHHWLDDHGIVPDGETILLRRIIRDNGRTGAWICGTSVSRPELEEFTGLLCDMHGQHEHQSLLKPAEHRRFLDDFAGISEDVVAFTKLYAELSDKKKQLQELQSAETDKQRRIELLEFALQEITAAKLKPNEDDELELEENRLSQFEKICTSLDQLLEIFSSGDSGAMILLKHCRQLLDVCSGVDTSLVPFLSRFESSYYEMDDIAESLRQYRDSLLFDPLRLEEIEERLALIGKLKKKYGQTITEISDYGESCSNQLAMLADSASNRESLQKAISDMEKNIMAAGSLLTQKRTVAAEQLSTSIMEILSDLGMKGTVFFIRIQPKNSDGRPPVCTPYGFDDIEFMISPNRGEPLRPLAKIASGGEISRVMLAIKSILAEVDESGTLVFDEIDAGIGGEVALAVGAHLKKLSAHTQILCITHQASIAARADNHIKIKKNAENNVTKTEAAVISGTERVAEIARMLAGDAAGETSLLHAKDLLGMYGGTDS